MRFGTLLLPLKMHYYTPSCLIIIVRIFLLHYLHGLLYRTSLPLRTPLDYFKYYTPFDSLTFAVMESTNVREIEHYRATAQLVLILFIIY